MLLRTVSWFALLGPLLISTVLSTTAYIGKVEEVKLKKREQSGGASGDHEATSYHYTLYPADQHAPASFSSSQAQFEAAAASGSSQQHQQNYIVPQSSFGSAPSAYGAPPQSYEVPQQSYGPAQQSHGVSQQSHGVSQQSFGVPQQTQYSFGGSTQQSYGAPQPTYGSPMESSSGYSSEQSGGYSGGQSGYSSGHSGGYGYGPPAQDDEESGGGIGTAIATIVGIKAIKAAKAFKAIKGSLVFWPLMLPLLPILLLPLLIPLVLLLLFLPIPVIIWPVCPQQQGRSFPNAGKGIEMARKVLESEECVERIACHLKQFSMKFNADQLMKKVSQSLGDKKGTWQAKMGKGLKEKGNCASSFSCNPIAAFKKAFASPLKNTSTQ